MSTASVAVRTREAADERLAQLRDRFGSFPLVERTTLDSPTRFDAGVEQFEEGFRGAAGARVTDERGRLLLLRERNAPDTWVHPGGGHEPGESLAETARREVYEEAGVECELTGVWVAVRKRFVDRAEPQRRGYLLEVVFEADAVGGEAGLYPERWDSFDDDDPDEEILEVGWFDAPPADAAPVVSDPWRWGQ
ncbi:MAG: NUDIX hydrolase [Halobaculum sp.]